MSADSAPAATATSFAEASDAVAAILSANGVRELFTMPGDAFPVLEAVARAHERGAAAPRIATCLHETVAVAAAHGHHMVSRVPQACLLHVDVGLQMAGGMLHNAQRARAGILLLGGRTPATWDGSRRGGRVIDMQWIQDRGDLGGTVRDYVKWSYDLQRTEPLPHVLQRALQIAAADPAGPVYVSLLREMLMEPLEATLSDPARHRPPQPSVPEIPALETLADWICGAERPIVVVGHAGREALAFERLGAFATAAATPVYSRGARANISSEHPMYLGTDHGAALAEADLVVLLDVEVPWTPAFQGVREDARIARLDIDPLKPEMGLWSFPADLLLSGSTTAALPILTELVLERRTRAQDARAEERRASVADAHRRREESLTGARPPSGAGPMAAAYVARCVAELVDEDTIVVDDSTTAIATNAEHIPILAPGSYFQPIGSSMGWGAGASLGAKLAAPEKTVISLNAEGNLFSGAPEAALWTAARLNAPFLTVVYDNAQYAAIKLGLTYEYPDSALARAGELELERAPDIPALAASCGAFAERVAAADGLPGALRRGLAAVRDGQCAVLDVTVQGP